MADHNLDAYNIFDLREKARKRLHLHKQVVIAREPTHSRCEIAG
jgi:hypothetical protein